MKKDGKVDLRELENRILALRDTEFDAVLEQGRVLGLAKLAFANEGEWVRWFAVERRIFGERHGQYLVNVAKWWDALPEEIRAEMPRHWGKCRDLAALSPVQLKGFLKTYDALGMTRDQVKTVVEEMLRAGGKQPRQMDFFATMKMPKLDRFVEAARDPACQIHGEKAASYAIVCASLAIRSVDQLSEQKRAHYAREFFEAARSLAGGDIHALLEVAASGK